jgi:hypothetical protein
MAAPDQQLAARPHDGCAVAAGNRRGWDRAPASSGSERDPELEPFIEGGHVTVQGVQGALDGGNLAFARGSDRDQLGAMAYQLAEHNGARAGPGDGAECGQDPAVVIRSPP